MHIVSTCRQRHTVKAVASDSVWLLCETKPPICMTTAMQIGAYCNFYFYLNFVFIILNSIHSFDATILKIVLFNILSVKL